MVHHLAELIKDAETATGPDRSAKVVVAIQAILALWDHRGTVDRIDPLRDLKPLLRAIKTLDPEENRFGIYFRRDGYRAVADAYSAFRELLIWELVRQSERSIDLAKVSDFVSEEERSIIDALNLWIADYQKKTLHENHAVKTKTASKKIDAKAWAIELIENTRKSLDALEDEIKGKKRERLETINSSLLRKLIGKNDSVETIEIEAVDSGDSED